VITIEGTSLRKLYSVGEAEMTKRVRTLVVAPWGDHIVRQRRRAGRVRLDEEADEEERNRAPHAQGYTLLQQARGTKARNRIHNRNRLPLKDPAGYGISEGCIANIGQFHSSPHMVRCFFALGRVR
jgi:hypothetical protein